MYNYTPLTNLATSMPAIVARSVIASRNSDPPQWKSDEYSPDIAYCSKTIIDWSFGLDIILVMLCTGHWTSNIDLSNALRARLEMGWHGTVCHIPTLHWSACNHIPILFIWNTIPVIGMSRGQYGWITLHEIYELALGPCFFYNSEWIRNCLSVALFLDPVGRAYSDPPDLLAVFVAGTPKRGKKHKWKEVMEKRKRKRKGRGRREWKAWVPAGIASGNMFPLSGNVVKCFLGCKCLKFQ